MFEESTRILAKDMWFKEDESHTSYENFVFIRLIAKERMFTKVSFKYTVFDSCYLRKCTFISCDFTGCRFTSSNLPGSTFDGCSFSYTIFEKTNIDSKILSNCCPSYENQKATFARSLRTNYQQLGDSEGVNRAIAVELKATEIHLHKAWRSNESYYRNKYKSWTKLKMLLKWLLYKFSNIIWGNGESPLKLFCTVLVVILGMGLLDIFFWRQTSGVGFLEAFSQAFQVFVGTPNLPLEFPEWYLAVIAVLRLTTFGLFVSILFRKYSRR